ncbi:hypothetical protein OESDEN_01007 [Oesophagostomum dentatum]|uniref:G-protein coupled receptors family 1 profile domain-containing protein n=1 Tax=Oesophagostomum dentatum TaxID=61180 RepID=A0A0B1TN64_OESDE|nr:hypothetical protein OESDEN_01007 [Oesophagostomum dentatum]
MTELSEETLLFMGLGLLVMGVVGFCICLVEAYVILRQCIIHPFKYFCLSHTIVHGAAQLVVVALFISTQLITEQWMNPSVIGYMAIALQFCSLYTSFAMSINRVLSVVIPLSYSSMFTKRNTRTVALAIWVFSFSTTVVLLIGVPFF